MLTFPSPQKAQTALESSELALQFGGSVIIAISGRNSTLAVDPERVRNLRLVGRAWAVGHGDRTSGRDGHLLPAGGASSPPLLRRPPGFAPPGF